MVLRFYMVFEWATTQTQSGFRAVPYGICMNNRSKTEATRELTVLPDCVVVFYWLYNPWFCIVFEWATTQTQSGFRAVPHSICMKNRSKTEATRELTLLPDCVVRFFFLLYKQWLYIVVEWATTQTQSGFRAFPHRICLENRCKTEATRELTVLPNCVVVFFLLYNPWFYIVFVWATTQTQSGFRAVPHSICMKNRSKTEATRE